MKRAIALFKRASLGGNGCFEHLNDFAEGGVSRAECLEPGARLKGFTRENGPERVRWKRNPRMGSRCRRCEADWCGFRWRGCGRGAVMRMWLSGSTEVYPVDGGVELLEQVVDGDDI